MPIPDGPALPALERVGAVGVTAAAIADAAPDLTLLQWRVLVVLEAAPDGLAVSALADQIGSRPSATSRLVGRMRARGLVGTRLDPADGRVHQVRIEAAGHALESST